MVSSLTVMSLRRWRAGWIRLVEVYFWVARILAEEESDREFSLEERLCFSSSCDASLTLPVEASR
jgi:hypothetical protein